MSIPRLDSSPIEAPAPDADSFNTALITRLAQEFWAQGPGSPVVDPTLPAAAAPSVPTALAGSPATPPVPPAPTASVPSRLPEIPGASASEERLSGGYPSVHPVLEPSERDPNRSAGTPSGAHEPGGRDSHPFGEPRFDGGAFGDVPPSANAAVPLPGTESVAEPDFYFLHGADSAKGSAARSTSRPGSGSGAALSVFDVENVRRDFPALHQRINGRPLVWLDNAATTHKPQSVIDATSRFYGRDNSNIHRAAHTLAARSTELFEAGREKVRQFLGASDAKEIIFVRGTTEAINLVAQSYGRQNVGAGDEIIVSEMEHHANIVPWQLLAQQVGAVIRVAPMNDRGELLVEEFVKLLSPRTKLVAVTHVSNALGTINPIEEIIGLSHGHGVPVLIDGAQSAPHIPINVTALDADFFVFSGHKTFGPTGIGALYGKAHLLEQMPPWQGGGHMIRDVTFAKTTYQHAPEKFEAGTPDIAGVVGLGAAIDYLVSLGLPAIAAYEHALLEYATNALSSVPGLRPIGTAAHKASVVSFVIPGLPSEQIAKHLDKHGIAVRSGHHCAQPAVRHFGLENTVRPSLAFYNTFEEIDALAQALHQLPKRPSSEHLR